MLLQKEKIRQIIQNHKIKALQAKDEEELINIFYEAFIEAGNEQENKLATKNDIELLVKMMDKRFEAVDKKFEDMQKTMDKRFEAVDKRFEDMQKSMDKRFEDVNKRFTMMFTFMNIGFGLIILLTILFKFITV